MADAPLKFKTGTVGSDGWDVLSDALAGATGWPLAGVVGPMVAYAAREGKNKLAKLGRGADSFQPQTDDINMDPNARGKSKTELDGILSGLGQEDPFDVKAFIEGSGIDPKASYAVGSSSGGARRFADPRLMPAISDMGQTMQRRAAVQGRVGRETASQMDDIEKATGAEVELLKGESAEVKAQFNQAKTERLAAIDKLDSMGVRPSQWWESEDRAVSALRLMSVAMGGVAKASGVSKANDAMEQINKLVDDDIRSQLAGIQKQQGIVGAKTSTLNLLRAELGDVNAAIETARAAMLTKLAWGAKRISAQSAGELASADASIAEKRVHVDALRSLGGQKTWQSQKQSGAALLAPALKEAAKAAAGGGGKPLPAGENRNLGKTFGSIKSLVGLVGELKKNGYGTLERYVPRTKASRLRKALELKVKRVISALEGRGSDYDAKSYKDALMSIWEDTQGTALALERLISDDITSTAHTLAMHAHSGYRVAGHIRGFRSIADPFQKSKKRSTMQKGFKK